MTFMKKQLFFLFALISALKLNAELPHTPVVYNGAGAPAEHKLTALSLAGIVNRESPRLYLVNVYQTWSYNQTDAGWLALYQEDAGINFQHATNIEDLIDLFRDDIQGVVTYDKGLTYGNFTGQNFRWQAEVAAMIGGLTNCIPLPYDGPFYDLEVADSLWVPDAFHGAEPVIISARLELSGHPWNQQSLSQEERYFSLLDWALDELLTRTNPRSFYLREITDWAINQRMFQLNLAGTESLNFYSLSDEKAEKIERVMNYLVDHMPDEVFHVYGWMRPEPLVQWISAWGGIFHETLLGNLSWHHIYPADPDFVYERPSAINPEGLELEDKHYVLFIGSEGDAGNWNLGFQAGAWLSPFRGQVPLGWGFNLHMFSMFPFVAQYYFRSATDTDGFVSVTTPLGYAYPDMYPEAMLPDAIEQSSQLLEKYRIASVYAYKHYNGAGVSTYRGVEISNNFDFNKLGSFAENTQTPLCFLFDPGLQTQTPYTQFGGLLYNHVNDNTFYANVTDIPASAQRISEKLRNKPRPGFLLAGYQRLRHDGLSVGSSNPADISLARLHQLMQLLKNDPELGEHIEFVTPETFTWLLRKKLAEDETTLAETNQPAHWSLSTMGGARWQIVFAGTLSEAVSIRIFDSLGRLYWQQSPRQYEAGFRLDIPCESWTAGLYIIQLKGNGIQQSQRFFVNVY